MNIRNKRKPNSWVRYDRSLMRDKRIKSNHKQLYLLFCSLSESCDHIYPSYAWIAEELGYEYNGEFEIGSPQHERAMKKFVSDNLKPLIELGWIKKTNIKGQSCDYEVYDHDCEEIVDDNQSYHEQKSTHPVNKKVHTTVNKKVHQVKRREIKEEDRAFNQIDWTQFDTYPELLDYIKLRGWNKQDVLFSLPVNAFTYWNIDYTDTLYG